jgi:hypothetical protein
VAKPVAQVAARKEKMMRGERWMFLSRLPWVIAVFITAMVIMGIVVQVSGADISLGRWTPSDTSQLLSARRYSMGTALGIIGIALAVISLWLGWRWNRASKREIIKVRDEAVAARVVLSNRLDEGVAVKLEDPSGKWGRADFKRQEGIEPGPDMRGIWVVELSDQEPVVVHDRHEFEALLSDWMEEDDEEDR